MFCPKCHMRFVKSFEENGEVFDVCVNGHEIKRDKNKSSSIHLKRTHREVIIDDREEREESIGGGIYLISCPYCGSKECTLIKTSTFYADEGETFLLKCQKCRRTFRSGSGDARGS